MSDRFSRLLGDTPGRTIVKLLILSVVVGFVMSMMGLSPWDLVRFIDNGIRLPLTRLSEEFHDLVRSAMRHAELTA